MNYSEICAGVVNGLRVLYVGLEEDFRAFCKIARINPRLVHKVWSADTIKVIPRQRDVEPDYILVMGSPSPHDWRNTREIMQEVRLKNIPVFDAESIMRESMWVNPPSVFQINGNTHCS